MSMLAQSFTLPDRNYNLLQKAANIKSWDKIKKQLPRTALYIQTHGLLGSLGLHNEHGIDILELPAKDSFSPKCKKLIKFYNTKELSKEMLKTVHRYDKQKIYASSLCKIYPKEYTGRYQTKGRILELSKLRSYSQAFGFCTDIKSEFYHEQVGYDYDLLYDKLMQLCRQVFFAFEMVKDPQKLQELLELEHKIDAKNWGDIVDKIYDLQPDLYFLAQFGEKKP